MTKEEYLEDLWKNRIDSQSENLKSSAKLLRNNILETLCDFSYGPYSVEDFEGLSAEIMTVVDSVINKYFEPLLVEDKIVEMFLERNSK